MSVYAGPEISNDGLIFYVDGKNPKSFSNSTLKSLVSNEQNPANVLIENGFINTEYKTIEKFEGFDISSASAISVNLLIKHEDQKAGFAFSINSPNLAVNTPSDQTLYTTSEVNTLSVNINSFYDRYENELSFYANNTEVIIKNKSSDYESILNYESLPNSSAVYSVIFKTFSGTNNPISLYQNGVLVSSTDPILNSSSSFQNLDVSLFNKNGSDYSGYGIRFISIYDKELTQLEAQTINKIQPIR